MTQPFTPRTPSRPASRPEAHLPATKKQGRKSLWHTWKPRLIKLSKRLFRQLTRLRVWLMRYVHGLSRTQRLQHAGIALALIACIFIFNQIFSRHSSTTPTTQTVESGAPLPKETPTFSTVLPSGKSAEDLGGWRRVSPSDRNPVYAYPDTVAGVSVIVSEQPIPDDFKSDLSGSIEKLSDGYSAGRIFDVDGTLVHIGKSAKGPQSLIFTKRDLLILIKSTSTVSDDQWKTYIRSLR
ncbi:MAG: hypothetical protein WBO35_03920 [Candidatus Saccharimonadales bacterium]